MNLSVDTVVIGGGVIGSSIAYQLAKRGRAVVLLERGRIGGQASGAAAGMLGAQSEMHEPGPMFDLARMSRELFPAAADELRELTGMDTGLTQSGMLKAAFTDADAAVLKADIHFQHGAGGRAEWLDAENACRLEPALSRDIRGAEYLPDEGHVLAPELTAALARGAELLGVQVIEHAEALELLTERGRICGVRTRGGTIRCAEAVLAAALWSDRLLAPLGVELPLYPVKGECFSLTGAAPLLKRTLTSAGCYIVPKPGGRIIVGATALPGSYDLQPRLGSLISLAAKAQRLAPVLAEAAWERTWAGLRPQTPDGLPYIGEISAFQGLFAALGHYRNGILLSQATGVLAATAITGGTAAVARELPGAEKLLQAFRPERGVLAGVSHE
ncbi:glycine oxidase ThiO [Paenibacillus sp. N10]|uniref:glycine oxidase n=2 Tax=Paenibacillus lutrae TaxID=2078573 RepID=A0A7X3FHT6_9BACL|nr:glycine oxidase ThiO [Paenibacillus lutrae]MVO99890.1 glycine oxidase ThiO [Paenibacillus lutrae]